jgi:hypothetical protein
VSLRKIVTLPSPLPRTRRDFSYAARIGYLHTNDLV